MNTMYRWKLPLMAVFLIAAAAGLGAQEDRLALVIGNSAYSGTARLKNAVNDANAVAAKLRSLKWDVTLVTDADIRKMETEINKFGDKLRTKKSPNVVFYYAGHGVEVDKVNYLVPIGAETVEDQRRLRREAYSFQDLTRLLEENGAWSSVFILDACRDDPFPKKPDTRGMIVSKPVGITAMDASPAVKGGTLSIFSASSGETSSDGTGRNGLFTEALIKRMESQDSLIQIFSQVRNDVVAATNGKQNPRLGEVALTDLSMNFAGKQIAAPVAAAPAAAPAAPAVPAAALGTMVITSKIAGHIFVNGEDYGEVAPGVALREPLEVGTHTIRFVPNDGSAPQEKQLSIPRAGSERSLDFAAVVGSAAAAAAAAPAARTPSLGDVGLGETFQLIVTGPQDGMNVLLNDEFKGQTPLTLTLQRARWDVTIAHPDYVTFSERITPPASGGSRQLSPNMDHTVAYKINKAKERRLALIGQINAKKSKSGFAGFLNGLSWLGFWGGAGFGGYSYVMGTQTSAAYSVSYDPETIIGLRDDLKKYDQWTKVGIATTGGSLVMAIFTSLFLPDVSKEERELRNAEAEIVRLGGRY